MIPLTSTNLIAANAFLTDLDAGWRKAAGLNSRADYSIAYAPVQPCSLMVLGMNPGGTPQNFKIADVANGQSEYVDGYGPTSKNIGRLLQKTLQLSSPAEIRAIQGSNVIWRRSPRMQAMGADLSAAAQETAPHLEKFISYVSPRLLLFAGKSAYDAFVPAHRARILKDGETLMGPNGRNEAVYFANKALALPYLPHPVDAFVILHPAKGLRDIAVERLAEHFNRIFER